MKKTNWLHRIDVITLGLLAVLSIILTVLDSFQLLDKIPLFSNFDFSKLSVGLLGLIGLFLAVERRTFTEENFTQLNENMSKMLETPQEIIKSLKGVSVQTFDSSFDLLKYATERVKNAKWIDDTSWGGELGHEAQTPENRNISIEHRQQVATVSMSHIHRELFTFDRSHLRDVLKTRLENKEYSGYSCAYYDTTPDILPLKFMIIDNEEVILLADTFKGNIAIKSPEIVAMFKAYYQALWSRAIIIKDANGVRRNIIEKLNKKFKAQDPNFEIVLP